MMLNESLQSRSDIIPTRIVSFHHGPTILSTTLVLRCTLSCHTNVLRTRTGAPSLPTPNARAGPQDIENYDFSRRTPPELNAFFQPWLFFGCLAQMLKTGGVQIDANDFIATKSSTEKLLRYLLSGNRSGRHPRTFQRHADATLCRVMQQTKDVVTSDAGSPSYAIATSTPFALPA
ncbi:hypothetical protein EDC04DRAFT_2624186 [Pisolithus marmoratus]|nr:hypothetical protein EDC04DRAFT_2624186 [Pisolithus marmoratus]